VSRTKISLSSKIFWMACHSEGGKGSTFLICVVGASWQVKVDLDAFYCAFWGL